jgi:hypothetical protein
MRVLLAALLLMSAPFPQKSRLEIKYDRFKDETTIRTPQMVIPGVANEHLSFSFAAAYPGRTKTQPETVTLEFLLEAPYAQFPDDAELILLVDGQRIKLGAITHVRDERRYGTTYQAGSFSATLDIITRVAHGSVIEGQLGPYEFRFLRQHMEGIRQLATYFELK